MMAADSRRPSSAHTRIHLYCACCCPPRCTSGDLSCRSCKCSEIFDSCLFMMQSTQSLMQLEELMMASIKLINYKHLGAIACKVPQLASAAQSQYTTPKQVQRIMLQLEKLYLQAMNVLPVRYLPLLSTTLHALCVHVDDLHDACNWR